MTFPKQVRLLRPKTQGVFILPYNWRLLKITGTNCYMSVLLDVMTDENGSEVHHNNPGIIVQKASKIK